MTVCRYFQQGSCRFGTNCHFEHLFPSKYVYQAPTSVPSSQPQYIQQIATEVDRALKGNQWMLSCYAPFKDKPNFPGLVDYSMEEVRLMMYDSDPTRSAQCASDLNQLYQSFHMAYKQLSNPSEVIKSHLETLFKGNLPNCLFSITPPDWTNRSLSFGSTNEQSFNLQSATNVVGDSFAASQPVIFNNTNANVSPSDLFASASNKLYGSNTSPESIFASAANARNIFASANQNQPNTSIFNQTNSNIFQHANTQNGAFHQGNLASNAFQQDFFQKQATFNQTGGDVFGKNNSYEIMESSGDPFNQQGSNFKNPVFGGSDITNNSAQALFQSANQAMFGSPFTVAAAKPKEIDGIYSKNEELRTEDINAYNSETFIIGCIPELPPTYGLCFS